MARPPGRLGSHTRERILEVALELFTERGYDKTSLRDIAERLDMTKAALYYHFERKADILVALYAQLEQVGFEVLDELEAAPDGPARAAVWPRLADEVIGFMLANRRLLLLRSRNRNAMDGLEPPPGEEDRDVEVRFDRILASPAIPLRERVRMAAMIGVITEVFAEHLDAFGDVAPDELAALVREAVADLAPSPVAVT